MGAGNGGVAFAFANCRSYRVHAIDIVPNPVLWRLNRRHPISIRYAVGSSLALPYLPESFDLVLLVDAIEHISDRRRMGREIMRVLRPGGICFVSTAARLRYLLRRDPHYGVRGLVALPNGMQRFVVDRLLRRRILTTDGSPWPAYDVEHIFWTVAEIGRLFPGASMVEGLYGKPLVGSAPMFSAEWWRWKTRGFLFDHVKVVKASSR